MLRPGARADSAGRAVNHRASEARGQAVRSLRRAEPRWRLLYELPEVIRRVDGYRTRRRARSRTGPRAAGGEEERHRQPLVRVDEHAAATGVRMGGSGGELETGCDDTVPADSGRAGTAGADRETRTVSATRAASACA